MHMATLHIVQSMLCQTNAKYLQTYSQFVSSLVCWYCADIVVLHSVVCCYCADIVVILWEVLWISTLGCCSVGSVGSKPQPMWLKFQQILTNLQTAVTQVLDEQ